VRGKRAALPAKLTSLRQKLGRKAKQEPKFRFYALYDRIYRAIFVGGVVAGASQRRQRWSRWRLDRDDRGREDGAMQLVEQLHEELRTKTYRHKPYGASTTQGEWEVETLGIPTVPHTSSRP